MESQRKRHRNLTFKLTIFCRTVLFHIFAWLWLIFEFLKVKPYYLKLHKQLHPELSLKIWIKSKKNRIRSATRKLKSELVWSISLPYCFTKIRYFCYQTSTKKGHTIHKSDMWNVVTFLTTKNINFIKVEKYMHIQRIVKKNTHPFKMYKKFYSWFNNVIRKKSMNKQVKLSTQMFF